MDEDQGPTNVPAPTLPPLRTFIFKLLNEDEKGRRTWVEKMIEAHSTQVTDGNSLLFFVVSLNPQGMYLRDAFNGGEWRGLHEMVGMAPATASVN